MKINFTLLTLFLNLHFFATAQTTYYTGFDNNTEKAGWVEYRKGATGPYQWGYSSIAPFSPNDCLYRDYPVGGTTITDDWFVSPVLHFPNGGKLDSIRHAFSGFGTPGTGDTLAIYLLVGSADPGSASSKILLVDFRNANYNNDNNWNQSKNINIPKIAENCYLAIRYTTVNNWLTVKFDNIGITSNAISFSPTIRNNSSFKVYPNPATNTITIDNTAYTNNSETHIFKIFGTMGQLLYETPLNAKTIVNLELGNGLYLYEICNADNSVVQNKTLIIQ